jgi:uncharacterized damage-inducible protein DinB
MSSIRIRAMSMPNWLMLSGMFLDALNRTLRGDGLWIVRFDGAAAQTAGIAKTPNARAELNGCGGACAEFDTRIPQWVLGPRGLDLRQILLWYSGVLKRKASNQLALCVTYFFNQQTHHRGQVHAMRAVAGAHARLVI